MKGLTVQDVYALNSLLGSHDAQTFQQISTAFRKSFSGKDALKVGLGIAALLREHDLTPDPRQRLVAIFLLLEVYNGNGQQITDNPFLPILLKLMSDKSEQRAAEDLVGNLPMLSIQEKYFMGQMLNGTGRDLLSKTPNQIVSLELPSLPPVNLSHLEASVVEMQSRFPLIAKTSAPSVIRVPDADAGKDLAYSEQQAALQACESLLAGNDAPAFGKPLPPDFIRLAPPLHVGENEFIFLHSIEASRFTPMWVDAGSTSATDSPSKTLSPAKSSKNSSKSPSKDVSATSSTTSSRRASPSGADSAKEKSSGSETAKDTNLELLEKALTGPLQTAESNKLIEALKADDTLVKRVNMSPEKLPKLVEDNPMIAVEVLYILIPTKEISTYFEALVNMDLSVHGMEVVNRLTTIVEVPEEFLNFYVSHCIRSCEEIKNSPFTQNRLVRMVCVFLSSLIRNRLISVKDLYIELQAFCINFSSVKEAAALFQTVQMVLRDEKGPDEAAGSN
uniref:CCR4-NOT transcription complex subunit 11 n=1 Tax=Plectus sambesii TaxID=2011161 RepID=A0A914VPA9_9BILA